MQESAFYHSNHLALPVQPGRLHRVTSGDHIKVITSYARQAIICRSSFNPREQITMADMHASTLSIVQFAGAYLEHLHSCGQQGVPVLDVWLRLFTKARPL